MDHQPLHPAQNPSREPLGEGFTERDRQFDQLLSRTLGDVAIPPGLTERIAASSLEELDATTEPFAFPVEDRRRSLPAQWLAMAACLGLLVIGGWWMHATSQHDSRPMAVEAVAVVPAPVQDTSTSISPVAELVLLETSRSDGFDGLAPYVATRDLRFEELSGDLVAVLDAIQNPVMGTYDLEFTP